MHAALNDSQAVVNKTESRYTENHVQPVQAAG